jgi:hypothetical protein
MTNSIKQNLGHSKKLIIATEVTCVFKFKHNPIYQFSEDLRCFNVLSERELKLVSVGNCLGFNIAGRFKSKSFIEKNLIRLKERKYITEEMILLAVCRKFECTEADLMGRSTKNDLSFARVIWVEMVYKYITNNLREVARKTGRSSHSHASDYLAKVVTFEIQSRVFVNSRNWVEAEINK